MLRLTRQERTVVATVLLLLLVGWAVRSWRAAHPGADPAPPAAPVLNAHRQL